MSKVILIQGACTDELDLDEFSLASILDEDDVENIKEARADNFMSSAENVEVVDILGQTLVKWFDYDGAAVVYIGTDFTGPRDI